MYCYNGHFFAVFGNQITTPDSTINTTVMETIQSFIIEGCDMPVLETN
jgi:hypothetical protein